MLNYHKSDRSWSLHSDAVEGAGEGDGESPDESGREGGCLTGRDRPSDGGREGLIPDKVIPDFVRGPVGHSPCEFFKE